MGVIRKADERNLAALGRDDNLLFMLVTAPVPTDIGTKPQDAPQQ